MQQIGPYQILKELGRGGMGVVYRGVDPVIGRHVAIKTLRPEDMGEASERGTMGDRLLREARSAGILSHPGIVTIYQAGQDQDILYIAMEFVDGANLADVLAQGRLNTEALLKILKQCAEALDYAHSKGVVHRDIKPGNILLEPSGKVKIADFGIAKLNQAGVTKTTSSVGSPAYMSPEHVRAQSIDGRADQYSLGVVAYEMLTGRRPHDSEELTSLVFKVVFEPPDLSLIQSLPAGSQLEPIFTRVLAKAADERFNSCVEFYDALAAVLESPKPGVALTPSPGAGVNVSSPALPRDPAAPSGSRIPTIAVPPTPAAPLGQPPAPSSNKGLLYAGVGLLVAVLAGGGYYAMNRPDPNKGGGGTTKGEGGGGDDTKQQPQERPNPPALVKQPACLSTPEIEALNIHGTVRVAFDVTETGQVDNVRTTKSLHKLIDQQAEQCVKTYQFRPADLHGKPVRYGGFAVDVAF